MSFESSKQKQSNLSALFSTDVATHGTTTGAIVLDFHDGVAQTTATLTDNVSFTTTNRGSGKFLTLRVVPGSSTRTFTSFADWVWLSSSEPASIAASKTGILSLTCYGTAETDIVAVWAVES